MRVAQAPACARGAGFFSAERACGQQRCVISACGETEGARGPLCEPASSGGGTGPPWDADRSADGLEPIERWADEKNRMDIIAEAQVGSTECYIGGCLDE